MQISAIRLSKPNNQLNIRQIQPRYVSGTLKNDTVSFSGRYKSERVNVGLDRAYRITNSLVSSTSGHRAIYGTPEFNADSIRLLSLGVAEYAKKAAKERGRKPMVMVGGDTREATRKLIGVVTDTLKNQGVNVVLVKKPVPTPLYAHMASTYTTGLIKNKAFLKKMKFPEEPKLPKEKCDIAVLLTASHNPWEYGGFNLVTNKGAIASNDIVREIAVCAMDFAKVRRYTIDKNNIGEVIKADPYEMYKNRLDSYYNLIDWNKIKNAKIDIYYDGLRGTGVSVVPRLMKDHGIKINNFVSSKQSGPEPNAKNLTELSQKVADSKKPLRIGLANDGDADRYGIIDENGQFVSANEILLLIAYHLHKNKGRTGAIIRSQATASLVDIYAEQNNLPLIQTPVGFKFIGESIEKLRKNNKDILVAGEETNGLTINGYIPEKDGIVAISLILDLMAEEKKPISQILADVKKSLGVEYGTAFIEKKLADNGIKDLIVGKVKKVYYDAIAGKTEFYGFKIDVKKTKDNMKTMEWFKPDGDGVKLYFTNGSSLLVRKSGTEPKIKAYVESAGDDKAAVDNNIEKLTKIADIILTP